MAVYDSLARQGAADAPPRDGREPLSLDRYVERVKQDARLVENAHQRLWRMVAAEGMVDAQGHPYPFFSRTLLGIDDTIKRVVEEYIRPAAMGFDVRRRILLLVGPVGSGKSTLVALLKRGLERFTSSREGALYAIVGCPMHEEPFHLLPLTERESLATAASNPRLLEGDLCPYCRWRLENEFLGRTDGFEVERIQLSESNRCGIGSYAPSDPKSQDVAELTGSVDFARIATFGTESDPRAFRFDGELNIANRGLVEFQEMLKLDERFLYHLLSLSEEGNFKTARYQLISADEAIIGHSNEHEYRTFKHHPGNQALLSRMVVIPVPYNLSIRDEVRIYQKQLLPYKKQAQHIAPQALQTAAVMAVLSRIPDDPRPQHDRMSRLEELAEQSAEAGDRRPGEGLTGLDPRYLMNRMAHAISAGSECVDAMDAIRALVEGVTRDPFVDAKWRESVEEWANVAERRVYAEIEAEVRKAFLIEGEGALYALYQNYMEQVIRSVEHADPGSIDERLLRAIEMRLEVSESQRHQFREEIYVAYRDLETRGAGASFLTQNSLLRGALEDKLFNDLRDVIQLSRPDGGDLAWIERAAANLVTSKGYCSVCATRAIRQVGAVLRR